jgi:Ca2+-binding RTX toxin-like protein
MGISVLCRIRRHVAGSAAVLALIIAPASVSAATTVGDSSPAPNDLCSGLAQDVMWGPTGPDYVVPSGSWVVTSWSTRMHGPSGQATLRLRVFRPTGNPNEYTIVGDSTVQALPTTSSLQTYPTSIPVEGGDVLGFVERDAYCLNRTGSSQDSYFADVESRSPGDTFTATSVGDGFRFSISAELNGGDTDAATIGQTGGSTDPGDSCSTRTVWVDRDYVIPAGGGTVQSFSFQSLQTGGELDFKVLRPLGGNQYTVVGSSGVKTLPSPGLHTFTLDSPIAAAAGDMLGFNIVGFTNVLGCYRSFGSGSVDASVATPQDGDTVTMIFPGQFEGLNVSAEVTPPPDTDADGVYDRDDDCPGTATGTVVAADGCPDPDADGVSTQAGDNCPDASNTDQADADRDRLGDACDPDDDNDGVADGSDSCAGTPAGTFVDTDGCDPCDSPAVITDSDNDKTIDGTEGDDVICGDADSEQVFGRGGNDRIYGRGGADSLNGGPGNDRLHGGDGNDTLLGFQGSDTMLGGGGVKDLVRYGPLVTVPLMIDLSSANGNGDGAAGEGDSVGDDVEQAMGGTKADRILGNGAHNTMHGGAGDDRMSGRAGADAMYGEAGNDSLTGNDDGTSADLLNCGANGGTAFPGPGDSVTSCT